MSNPPPLLSMELFFPSELGFEKVAREAVAAFARRLGFEPERIEDLKTALCEACINAIEHGNQQAPGLQVGVSCVCDDQRLLVEVDDQGLQRYQPRPTASTIESKLRGTDPLRGMGLVLIAQLVDEVGFKDSPGGGNRCWFVIHRHPAAQPQTPSNLDPNQHAASAREHQPCG